VNQTSGVDQSKKNPDLPDSSLDAPPSYQPTPALASSPVCAMPSVLATPGRQLGLSQPRRTMVSMLADLQANISREEEVEADNAEPLGSSAPCGQFINESLPQGEKQTISRANQQLLLLLDHCLERSLLTLISTWQWRNVSLSGKNPSTKANKMT
jgi:hypothetical protein